MGVSSEQQFWRFEHRSLALKDVFGRLKGLWKVHYELSALLSVWEEGRDRVAKAHLVQLLKALHQVALDQGQWENATLMLPTVPPDQRAPFGGSPGEMKAVFEYQKALRELRSGLRQRGPGPTSTSAPPLESAEDGDDADAAPAPARAKAKGKGRGHGRS